MFSMKWIGLVLSVLLEVGFAVGLMLFLAGIIYSLTILL